MFFNLLECIHDFLRKKRVGLKRFVSLPTDKYTVCIHGPPKKEAKKNNNKIGELYLKFRAELGPSEYYIIPKFQNLSLEGF